MPRPLVTNALLVVAALVAADAILAQIGKRAVDSWRNEEQELETRIADPVYHHGLKPLASFTHRFGGAAAPYFTNSLGFRDAAPRQVPLQSSRPRVLFIGDSVTEGVGIAFEDTFVGRIAASVSTAGIEVLNAAVTSYSPSIYDRKIRHVIGEMKLDVSAVVVFIDLSDAEDEARYYRMDESENVIGVPRKASRELADRFKRFLKGNSVAYRLYRTVKDDLSERRRRETLGPIGAVTGRARSRWTVDDALYERIGKPGLEKGRASMDKLLAFLKSRGIALSIAVYPWPDQILARDLDSRQVRFWRTWAKENGVGFVDLFPYFVDGRDPARVILEDFLPYDTHFNAAGHALVAKGFLENCPLVSGACGRAVNP